MKGWVAKKAFDWGAVPYDILTGQRFWRSHCESLTRRFPSEPGLKVLDLGCGPGVSAIAVARAREDASVVGVDLSKKMLGRARAKAKKQAPGQRVTLVCSDGKCLPFGDGSFHVITAHSFLYLVDDPQALLAEAARVLVPRGRCVFFEPSEKVDLSALTSSLASIRFGLSMIGWRVMSRINGRFNRASLRATFEQAGFRILSVEKTLFSLGLVITSEKGNL